MKLVDAHCHLEAKDFPVPGEAVGRAREVGLVHAVVVGLWQRPGDFGAALEVARAHPEFLTPTMGIHPHDSAQATPQDWDTLARLVALPEVKAVGEAGLDYFYNHSPPASQVEGLRRQAALAVAVGKPLVVHVRDAHEDCRQHLAVSGVREGMIHCFTGDTAAARRYLDLGFHLSISGVVTYKKTEALQEAVRFAPLDRLLLETDSPYLSPVPLRGKRNEPAHLVHTARKVAELKGLDPEQVAETCSENTLKLLRVELG